MDVKVITFEVNVSRINMCTNSVFMIVCASTMLCLPFCYVCASALLILFFSLINFIPTLPRRECTQVANPVATPDLCLRL